MTCRMPPVFAHSRSTYTRAHPAHIHIQQGAENVATNEQKKNSQINIYFPIVLNREQSWARELCVL